MYGYAPPDAEPAEPAFMATTESSRAPFPADEAAKKQRFAAVSPNASFMQPTQSFSRRSDDSPHVVKGNEAQLAMHRAEQKRARRKLRRLKRKQARLERLREEEDQFNDAMDALKHTPASMLAAAAAASASSSPRKKSPNSSVVYTDMEDTSSEEEHLSDDDDDTTALPLSEQKTQHGESSAQPIVQATTAMVTALTETHAPPLSPASSVSSDDLEPIMAN
jgi:hypothetical protein